MSSSYRDDVHRESNEGARLQHSLAASQIVQLLSCQNMAYNANYPLRRDLLLWVSFEHERSTTSCHNTNICRGGPSWPTSGCSHILYKYRHLFERFVKHCSPNGEFRTGSRLDLHLGTGSGTVHMLHLGIVPMLCSKNCSVRHNKCRLWRPGPHRRMPNWTGLYRPHCPSVRQHCDAPRWLQHYNLRCQQHWCC